MIYAVLNETKSVKLACECKIEWDELYTKKWEYRTILKYEEDENDVNVNSSI